MMQQWRISKKTLENLRQILGNLIPFPSVAKCSRRMNKIISSFFKKKEKIRIRSLCFLINE
jgi:hypothetical protein